MNSLNKFVGFAALLMALSHTIGIIIFLVVLDYTSITDPVQKVALNVTNMWSFFQPTC